MMDYVQRPPEPEDIAAALNCFEKETVSEILQGLTNDGSEWAMSQAKNLSKKSPLALSVTLEALSRGARLDFRTAMQRELDYSLGFLKTQDFYEGIRAQLIDKDRNPKWSHEAVDVVTNCLLYTSPSPRDATLSRMPSSA